MKYVFYISTLSAHKVSSIAFWIDRHIVTFDHISLSTFWMSNFVVSARKYRPSTFDEVIGQDHVAKTLKNALIQDKLAHAFLFCGPRGVGKTTNARILAKVINCLNPIGQVDPCNECSSCKSFNDNASFNIIELDAASNNSVEAIRTLIEQVRFQPQQGSHKVFIIDEVHMLSTAAFNAFLKTLEEPPPYAIFILATTEKHKILPTILSRCQIFDFKRIQIVDIVKQLEQICYTENRTAEPEALQMIAQKADGAMRDALSIYDKIASAAEEHITYQDVIQQLNILDYDYFFKMTDHLLREDFSQVLLTLDKVLRQGFEVDLFIQGLAEHMRNLMVCRHPETLAILEISEAAMKRYHNQARVCTQSFLLSALNLLNQCDIHLSTASNKRLYAEIALSKICYLARAIEADLVPSTDSEKKNLASSDSPRNEENVVNEEEKIPTVGIDPTVATQSQFVPATKKGTVEKPEKKENTPVTTTGQQTAKEVKSDQSHIDSSVEEAKDDTEVTPSNPKSSTSKILDTPSFSSIESLMSMVKQEEEKKKEAREKMSIDAVNEIWNSYIEHNNSASVKVALQNSMRSLQGKTITIIVPSENAKNIIIQEEQLKENLRTQLGAEDLILDLVVDRSHFPDIKEVKPKKLYSNKEKYLLMRDKNPLIDELKSRFQLKIDK